MMLENLWKFENDKQKGFRNGKYYIYTGEDGSDEIGPGIRLTNNKALRKKFANGATREEIDSYLNELVEGYYR